MVYGLFMTACVILHCSENFSIVCAQVFSSLSLVFDNKISKSYAIRAMFICFTNFWQLNHAKRWNSHEQMLYKAMFHLNSYQTGWTKWMFAKYFA